MFRGRHPSIVVPRYVNRRSDNFPRQLYKRELHLLEPSEGFSHEIS
jgi:hypothetical protein